MSALSQPSFWPHATAETRRRATLLPNLLSLAILSTGLLAWYFEIPLALAAILPPALWLASVAPERLVALLLLTAPMFPVLRLAEERLNVQQISTKGAFLSIDDPLIAALAATAIWRLITRRESRVPLFPSALAGLACLYPLVIALNTLRLDLTQSLVSLLAYLKWLQYSVLIFFIPVLLPARSVPAMLRLFRRALVTALLASAACAAFEVAESLRTGSYTYAARFPRASAFFGTLDPLRFGASEDPVNFGCFMMAAGSIALAYSSRSNGRGFLSGTAGVLAAILGVLLSVSRTPMLAAAIAFFKVQKIRSARILLIAFIAIFSGALVYLFLPSVWQSTFERFEAVLDWDSNLESSAESRINIALNAPVFQVDSYWIAGHGHSAYRFVAEEHLSRITRGVSRSLYNFFLTVWYDLGLAGTCLWIALFVQLLRKFRTLAAESRHPELQALAFGLWGATWGILTAAFFGETPYNWRVMGFYYASAGVCLAAARWERKAGPR